MNKTVKAHIYALLANVIYGANYTIAKNLLRNYIHPMGFILLRVLGASILFVAINPFIKREKIERKDFPLLIACGLFGVAINQLLFFKGLDLTSAIDASLIITTNPMIVLVVAAIFIKEKITAGKIFGILAGAGGAVILILFSKQPSDGKHAILGDFWIFINAFSYAIYLVIAKPLMKKYHPITVVKWVFIFGLPMVIPFGWGELSDVKWSTFNANTWAGVAFVVIGATFLAYLFNIIALKDVSAEVVSIYIYLQPLLATAISLYFSHEKITMTQVFASLLIFSGVYLVSYSSFKEK